MAEVDFASIEKILLDAQRQGRLSLYEHECYDLLSSTGAEAAPVHRLILRDRCRRAPISRRS